MRKLVFFLIFPLMLTAQRRTIDSINNLPYEIKSGRATKLDSVYLQNARAARRIGYVSGEAGSYSNLGLVYFYQGKFSQSVAYQLKAVALYEKTGDREKLAAEYGAMGYMMKRRDMARAQSYMVRAKSIAEADSLFKPLSAIYDNYGVLKEMQGQLDSAEFYYGKSLSLKERFADSVGIPYSLNNLSGIAAMRGRYSKALPLIRRALEIRRRLRDTVGMAENYLNEGALYVQQKQYGNAVAALAKARDMAARAGYIQALQQAHQSLAEAYEKMGRTADAYRHYKLYTSYKDSILNKETNNRIAELDIRYETSKKQQQLIRQRAEMRQRNYVIFGLCVVALFLVLTGFLIYRQQRTRNAQLRQEHQLKSAIAEIETQHKLQEQRLEISRDLHDNIGSQLTFIISSMDNVKYGFGLGGTKLGNKLESIGNFTRDTITELRDTIWAMNHTAMTFEDLENRMLNLIEKAREARPGLSVTFSVDDELRALPLASVQGMNMYRVMQEAVNNALKYADATSITVSIVRADTLQILVSDNGKGFDESSVELGNGILNMQKRTEDIGGRFSISSSPGNGTTISMQIPLKQDL